MIASTVWLDLFAGSGGIGIEALSRGAKFCWFVDNEPQACKTISCNLVNLGLTNDKAMLLCTDAQDACRIIGKKQGRVIDFAYLDPPYNKPDFYVKAIMSVKSVLAPGGLVVIEHGKDYSPTVPYAHHLRTRTYGLSAVSFYDSGKGDE